MDKPINGELVPQGGGDSIPLTRSPLILGRRESCDVCLQFANVSGKHCELTFKDGFWILRDLDSTNGTKVNGQLVHKKVIRNGDTIKIGQRNFTLQYEELGSPIALEDFDAELAEAMSMPLLEKAGLAHEPRHGKTARKAVPTEDAEELPEKPVE
jgi:pSer/pThr/pTyr-binding forkhead associated (FHA) protein